MPSPTEGRTDVPTTVASAQKSGAVHSESAVHAAPIPSVVLLMHVWLVGSQCSFAGHVPASGSHGFVTHFPSMHTALPAHVAPSSMRPLQLLSLPSQISGAPGYTVGSLSSQSTFVGLPWASSDPHHVKPSPSASQSLPSSTLPLQSLSR